MLLIAGIHGNEVTGTNSLYHLMDIFKKDYYSNGEIQNFISNVWLLLLPMANVSGFDWISREEFWGDKKYDPNWDFPFNIDPKLGCLNSSTA